MYRFVCFFVTLLICGALFGEPDAAPKFEIADVHASAKGRNIFGRGGGLARGGRFEMKSSTMVDLIRSAYGYSNDRILEGPNWIDMDRFDVIAKVPAGTPPDVQKAMLQSLLEDRFALKVRKEDRPLPNYALIVGKKPLMKAADGSGESGCKPKAAAGSAPGPEGSIRIGLNGVQFTLAPGGLIEYNCRNMTMADFAGGLRQMFGVGDLGQGPVKDETGIEGIWNFDLRFSIGFIGLLGQQAGDRITIAEAVEKQLGLKLDKRMVPTPVLVVESANRKPTDNPPGIAEALPPVKTPTEFEVADVKPSAPGGRGGAMRNGAGGRLTGQGIAMRLLLMRAFNSTTLSDEDLIGVPEWANTTRFDINAKAPSDAGQAVDMDAMGVMIRSLLVDRFKLKWHTEERPLTTYTLVAVKPKMKRADPKVRSSCRFENAPAGSPPGSNSLVCQDVTMEQFADQLQGAGPGLNFPITDSTELEGGWDFTLTYSRIPAAALAAMAAGPGRGGGDAGIAGSPLPSASEPSGALTIFEAVEKQLGLKLAPRKKNMPVTVIDHLEQTPTEN
jgi:uncharacterized protein (TIGR03435 family)